MRRNLQLLATLMVGLVAVVGVAGCSDAEKQLDKAKSDIGEVVIRNVASLAGSAVFEDNGYPLSKRLACTATVSSDNVATVACTGTTKDGKPVTLDGTANDDTAKKGSFVGKVAGQTVFSQDCLDCKK
jgi:hypothetical protein